MDTETVRELFAHWKIIRELTRSWRLERARLEPFVEALGDVKAIDVNPVAWADFRSRRRSFKGKHLHPATLDTELIRARQMFGWAVREKRLSRNPLAEAKLSGARSARETWLTWEQVETLLGACRPNPFLHAWVLVAVGTGMRLAETLTLRHDRIGGDGVVTINAVQTKSKRKRIIALPPRAMEAVAGLPRHYTSPYVFWSKQTAKSIHPSTLEKWFREAVEKCGLDAICAEGDKKLRPHDCRHSHASLADAAGASPTAISEQLGHADLRTTSRYLHRKQSDRALEIAGLMERRPAKRAPVVVNSETSSDRLKFS